MTGAAPGTAGAGLDEGPVVGYLCRQVMSLSDKPRLAEQQPSDRGGVLRVRTGSETTSAALHHKAQR